jgi:undecaprenyl-diphosphatase
VYFFIVIPKKAVVAAAALAFVAYVGLWIGVANQWSWLMSVDSWTLHEFHDMGVDSPRWVGAWRAISDVFGPTTLRIAAIAGIVIALIRRQVRIAGFLLVTVVAAGLVTTAAKALSERPRPATALTQVGSSSFPSGHALGITVGVLAFGTLIWPRIRPPLHALLVAVGLTLILVVGLSRVVLNVHYPSDVIAGWALGFVFYLVCMSLVAPQREPTLNREEPQAG